MRGVDARAGAALLLALGGILVRLGLGDDVLAYVKPSMRLWLVLAGVVLLVLGGHGLFNAVRTPRPAEPALGEQARPPGVSLEDSPPVASSRDVAPAYSMEDDTSGHAHAAGPAVAWFLVAPLLALLLIAPPALGSFAAARQGTAPPAANQGAFAELPDPVDGAVPLAMSEYQYRAIYDPSLSLDGIRVRLTGFVMPSDSPGSYLLARFTVNCCAADATARTVEVLGDGSHEADTWLEVEGYWQPIPDHEPGTVSEQPPRITAERVTAIPAPAEPYEY